MTLAELIASARRISGDRSNPYFWTDEDWTGFLNEAAEDAAIRARLLEDDQISVAVTAGDAYADSPAHVWSIQRVFLRGQRLQLVDYQMLDSSEGEGWEERTGCPQACYEVDGRLRFYPIPDADGEARLIAFCVPAKPLDISDMNAAPGLPERTHKHLLDGALALAFNDLDADTFDPTRAARHEAAFERNFGLRPDYTALRRKRLNVRRFVAGAYF